MKKIHLRLGCSVLLAAMLAAGVYTTGVLIDGFSNGRVELGGGYYIHRGEGDYVCIMRGDTSIVFPTGDPRGEQPIMKIAISENYAIGQTYLTGSSADTQKAYFAFDVQTGRSTRFTSMPELIKWHDTAVHAPTPELVDALQFVRKNHEKKRAASERPLPRTPSPSKSAGTD